jgi:hypothetical protein
MVCDDVCDPMCDEKYREFIYEKSFYTEKQRGIPGIEGGRGKEKRN